MCPRYWVNVITYTIKWCCMRTNEFQIFIWEVRTTPLTSPRVALEKTTKSPWNDHWLTILRRYPQSQCSLGHLHWRPEGSGNLGPTWTPLWRSLNYSPSIYGRPHYHGSICHLREGLCHKGELQQKVTYNLDEMYPFHFLHRMVALSSSYVKLQSPEKKAVNILRYVPCCKECSILYPNVY